MEGTCERERMAAENPEERETRLQRMSTNQHERLTVETPEERETRLQQMRDRPHPYLLENVEHCGGEHEQADTGYYVIDE